MEARLERWLWKNRGGQEREKALVEMEKRLKSAAGSYAELAKQFSSYITHKQALDGQDVCRMAEQVSGRLCRGCARYQECWEKNFGACCDALLFGLQKTVEDGRIEYDGLPEYFRSHCVRIPELLAEWNGCVRDETMKLSAFNRVMESRDALVRQLTETANYIAALPDQLLKEARLGEEAETHLKRLLHRYHVRAREIRLYQHRGKGRELHARLRCEAGRSVSVRMVERLISDLLGHAVRENGQWRRRVSEEEREFVFLEEPDYVVRTGVACTAKLGEEVSGDSFSFFYQNEGEVAMILSDGMGSGEEAAKESETVLKMLEGLLSAGFREETAIRLINSVLALRAEQRSFATLDLSILNLYTGICEFVKIGGAATFLKRGNILERVEAGTLPIGMLQTVDYDSLTKKLYGGDFIIMMSDGVLDAVAREQQYDFLQQAFETPKEQNPQAVAGRLLRAALERQNFEPRDDMTVLVCGMFENVP